MPLITILYSPCATASASLQKVSIKTIFSVLVQQATSNQQKKELFGMWLKLANKRQLHAVLLKPFDIIWMKIGLK